MLQPRTSTDETSTPRELFSKQIRSQFEGQRGEREERGGSPKSISPNQRAPCRDGPTGTTPSLLPRQSQPQGIRAIPGASAKGSGRQTPRRSRVPALRWPGAGQRWEMAGGTGTAAFQRDLFERRTATDSGCNLWFCSRRCRRDHPQQGCCALRLQLHSWALQLQLWVSPWQGCQSQGK